jgi:hypothetical protein
MGPGYLFEIMYPVLFFRPLFFFFLVSLAEYKTQVKQDEPGRWNVIRGTFWKQAF